MGPNFMSIFWKTALVTIACSWIGSDPITFTYEAFASFEDGIRGREQEYQFRPEWQNFAARERR